MSRRNQIIETGLMLWRQDASLVSARRIGSVLGISHAACLYHFKDAADMHACIADAAVRSGDPVIIPQLIVAGHAAVSGMDRDERQRYLSAM